MPSQSATRSQDHRITLAGKAVALWVFSAAIAIVMLRQIYGETGQAYASFEFELPLLTRAALTAASFLDQDTGLFAAVGALGASALPFALGARGRTAAHAYFALTVIGVLALSSSWFALHGPLDVLSQKLQAAPPGG